MTEKLPDWKNPIIKKGEVIALGDGEYSHHQIYAFFIARKVFNIKRYYAKYLLMYEKLTSEDRCSGFYIFTLWLERRGLIISYDNFRELDLDDFTDKK